MPPRATDAGAPGPERSGAPAFWSGDDRQRAQSLLALVYQTAVAVLTKLGETDLAWIASECGLAAT